MQVNVQFRVVAKVISYIQFALAIFGIFSLVIISGLAIFELAALRDGPEIPAFPVEVVCVIALFLCAFGLITVSISAWIAKGLIRATNVKVDISDALLLTNRWKLWFALITIPQIIFLVTCAMCLPQYYYLQIVPWVYFLTRGLIFYFVNQFVKSLGTKPVDIF